MSDFPTFDSPIIINIYIFFFLLSAITFSSNFLNFLLWIIKSLYKKYSKCISKYVFLIFR